jgi:hypothetical protein
MKKAINGVSDFSKYARILNYINMDEFLFGQSTYPSQEAPSGFPQQNQLNSAIRLFSRIFLSPFLNERNKHQLLKHFTVNV